MLADDELFLIENEYGKVRYFKNDFEMLKQVGANLIFDQYYVVNYLMANIVSSNVVLDIGAHCGSHTVLYKAMNPDLEVYAFEPQSRLFELLESNVELNGLTDVHCLNTAVGNRIGGAVMNNFSTDGENAYSSLEYGTDKVMNLAGVQVCEDSLSESSGESVRMITIDSLNLSDCDFMKIDVEGFEPYVLLGAMETIDKFSPNISFESNQKTCNAGVTSFEVLHELGYLCVNLSGDDWVAFRK